ncbi:MAG: zinc ribbon domain-containing protein [Chitinophagales bacterium]|nr:zinc ribbon domain-containing protein [Hyphomicrobiales bacterium]
MPFYDYQCIACGIFTARRSMAESSEATQCETCGQAAPRAYVTSPAIAGMNAGRRNAIERNEKSAHSPMRSSERHGANCGCCGSRKSKQHAAADPPAAKSFPKARPWMISH